MLRRPSVVFEMIGNSATSDAHTTIDAVGFLIQMMISGAIATIGVTCSSTAYGNSAVSSSLFCTNRNEISTPATVATANANSVILTVTTSAEQSTSQSVTSVFSISAGDGKRYGGHSYPLTSPSTTSGRK